MDRSANQHRRHRTLAAIAAVWLCTSFGALWWDARATQARAGLCATNIETPRTPE